MDERTLARWRELREQFWTQRRADCNEEDSAISSPPNHISDTADVHLFLHAISTEPAFGEWSDGDFIFDDEGPL